MRKHTSRDAAWRGAGGVRRTEAGVASASGD